VKDKAPFVERESIGEAYFVALDFIVNKKFPYHYLTLHISQPVLISPTGNLPSSLDVDDWREIINLERSIYKGFSTFEFSEKCSSGGSSGKDWINDRVRALLDPAGKYQERLHTQIEDVKKRLKARNKAGGKMHGSSTNALVCQVFVPDKDLVKACEPRPLAKNLPCLTQIDFKPKGDKLNLFSIWRSQYFDTKAYGNLISLAILLCKICHETGYRPGFLVSTANNLTFQTRKAKELCERLHSSRLGYRG
jgi:hypothetical protein